MKKILIAAIFLSMIAQSKTVFAEDKLSNEQIKKSKSNIAIASKKKEDNKQTITKLNETVDSLKKEIEYKETFNELLIDDVIESNITLTQNQYKLSSLNSEVSKDVPNKSTDSILINTTNVKIEDKPIKKEIKELKEIIKEEKSFNKEINQKYSSEQEYIIDKKLEEIHLINEIDLIEEENSKVDKNIETETKTLELERKKLKDTIFAMPAQGYISSRFGWRSHWSGSGELEWHTGLDIAGSGEIKSALKGRVIKAGWDSCGGNMMYVDHGNVNGKHLITAYAHLSSFVANVDDIVERGQTIGIMGTTGCSTGTHLHFEVHVNNKQVDPELFLKDSYKEIE